MASWVSCMKCSRDNGRGSRGVFYLLFCPGASVEWPCVSQGGSSPTASTITRRKHRGRHLAGAPGDVIVIVEDEAAGGRPIRGHAHISSRVQAQQLHYLQPSTRREGSRLSSSKKIGSYLWTACIARCPLPLPASLLFSRLQYSCRCLLLRVCETSHQVVVLLPARIASTIVVSLLSRRFLYFFFADPLPFATEFALKAGPQGRWEFNDRNGGGPTDGATRIRRIAAQVAIDISGA